jgi:asparagine synthase (glutamine-hydrolysing)
MPPELSGKKKQGGFAPLPIFFKSDANLDLIEKVILQSGITEMGLNSAWIQQYVNRYRKERSDQSNWFWYTQLQAFRMFNLLVLSVWWEMVINGRNVNTLDELISR